LAVGPEHDVGGLQVAVEHPPAMGVLDCVANADKPTEQSAQLDRALAGVAGRCGPGSRSGRTQVRAFVALAALKVRAASVVKPLDRLLEALAADQAHRVVRPAIWVVSEPVDRDDAGMLQPSGDLGLHQEPIATIVRVGAPEPDLLEGDLAVELGVECDRY